jgi:uncharacterized protein YndB with AHSA1/START domain
VSRHQVAIEIQARPEDIYGLLADVRRMGEWSPECVRCRWLRGATAARPGARFRGTSRNGWHRWSTRATIVTADPGRQLAFDVTYLGLPVASWRYDFTPGDALSTVLTESVVDRRGRFLRTFSPFITGARDREERNDQTMHATLQCLKAVAERS